MSYMVLTVAHDVPGKRPGILTVYAIVSYYLDVGLGIAVHDVADQDLRGGDSCLKGPGYCNIMTEFIFEYVSP